MLDFSVTLVITIINITVLFFILRAILFKPVTKFMADRAKRIQDSIDKAESSRSEAMKLLGRHQDMLANAEAEAGEIIKAARETASAEARRIIAGGKAEAEAMAVAARSQIELERQAVLAKFRAEAIALVMAASARLLQREVSGDDNRRFADMLLEEAASQFASKKRDR
jgi:F-type H+-transporting ATPase subunit b